MKTWSSRQAAVQRRDARHVHDGPEVAKPTGGKKDTRRWCRGKVGREHTLACLKVAPCLIGRTDIYKEHRVLACIVCGKQVARYWGGRVQPKPAWVTL